MCSNLCANTALTALQLRGPLSYATGEALGEALATNTTLINLELQFGRLSDAAGEALTRNRELLELWVAIARVVRFGDARGLRAVVNVLNPCGFQVKVFSCFWPQCCV